MADLIIFANANASMSDNPLMLQATGGDAAIDYTAPDVRQLIEAVTQDGVCGMGDFRVTQRGAGANLSVDIAAGKGSVKGTSVTRQGRFLADSTGTVNTGTAGNITVPGSGTRTHRVIARMRDKQASGTAYGWSFEVLEDTGSGMPALPASSLDLASIAVPTGSASVTDAMITDRRSYACPSIPLSIQVLAAPAATVSFTGIPGFIRGLELDWSTRCDAVGGSFFFIGRINGDTGGNYARMYRRWTGNGTATPTASNTADVSTSMEFGVIPGTATSAGIFAEGDCKIPKWRTDGTSLRVRAFNRAGFNEAISNCSTTHAENFWVGTTPPTSITLSAASGSLIAGSQFILRAIA